MGAWQGSTRRSRLPADWATRVVPRILRRDRLKCQLAYEDVCTGRATQVDHIKHGDDHRDSNLQAVCGPCHGRKSGREGGTASAHVRAGGRMPTESHPGLIR